MNTWVTTLPVFTTALPKKVILIKFDVTYQKFKFCDIIIQFTGQSSRRGYDLAASKNRYAGYAKQILNPEVHFLLLKLLLCRHLQIYKIDKLNISS